MNVSNQPSIRGGDNLVGRMRQAHAEEVSQTATASGDEVSKSEAKSGAAAASSLQDAARAAVPDDASPLEERLIDTARKVLESQFDSPTEIRESVVDSIVQERYAGLVDGPDREALVETVKQTLGEDVGFRAEVDNMLLHAARRLGQAQSHGR